MSYFEVDYEQAVVLVESALDSIRERDAGDAEDDLVEASNSLPEDWEPRQSLWLAIEAIDARDWSEASELVESVLSELRDLDLEADGV